MIFFPYENGIASHYHERFHTVGEVHGFCTCECLVRHAVILPWVEGHGRCAAVSTWEWCVCDFREYRGFCATVGASPLVSGCAGRQLPWILTRGSVVWCFGGFLSQTLWLLP